MTESPHADVGSCAARLAERIAGVVDSFDSARSAEYQQLLDAVKSTHPQFAFERDGRPAAIAAIRAALPQMERELLDAVLEDHACELAATEEALFQLARALVSRQEGAG